MDCHQNLYKSALLAGAQTQRRNENRERQNESRAKERKRIFLSRRNIEELEDDKENASADVTAAAPLPLANSTCIEKVVPAAAAKLSRQEVYLQRFIKYKVAKEQRGTQKPLKRPFLPAGSSNAGKTLEIAPTVKKIKSAGSAVASSLPISFAPKNHKFDASAGLRKPTAKEEPTSVVPSNADVCNGKLRQSVYTVVPTPPRKKKPGEVEKSSKRAVPTLRSVAMASQWLCPKSIDRPQAQQQQNTTPAARATMKAAAATTKTATKLNPTPGVNRNPLLLAQAKSRKTPVATAATTSNANSKTTAAASAAATATKKNLAPDFVKPRPLKLPAATPSAAARQVKKPAVAAASARILKPIRGAADGAGAAADAGVGASGKAKLQLLQKRPPPKAKLSVCMKAKKPTAASGASNAIRRAPAAFKLNSKLLLDVPGAAELPEIAAETPTNFLNNANPFGGAFITSTKLRAVSVDSKKLSDICDGISPVEAPRAGAADDKPDSSSKRSSSGQQGHASSAAKRALLQGNIEIRKGSSGGTEKAKKKMFNFVRVEDLSLSVLPAEELGSSPAEEDEKKAPHCDQTLVEAPAETFAVQLEKVEDPDEDRTLQKTPSKEDNAERPANYLSPFVSVSRGKVNSKKEREKRNSIYLQQPSPPPSEMAKNLADVSKSLEASVVASTTATSAVEMRRTLETVRYFRQQVSDEKARLDAICDQWEAYKSEHLARLQETGGEDMINVTIGQTRLLTSKKFKQFSGLIDRCEAGARGTGVENNGSEDTKPITAVDLEGFWCMVGLQVDNVNKRFENLARWKANGWLDPDALDEPPLNVSETTRTTNKPKKNLNKVKKSKAAAKAKPSSSLQQMLRKMHADMRKNKAEEALAVAEAHVDDDYEAGNADVVTTPTRKRRSQSGTPRSSTPRRISVIVRDRKSRSAAATVISIPVNTASAARRDSLGAQNSPIAPHMRRHVMALRRRSIANLQKAALVNAAAAAATNEERHSLAPPPSTPPSAPPRSPTAASSARKSILKTPGTANGKKKNVIFNQKVYMKKFKFTVTEGEHSDADDQ